MGLSMRASMAYGRAASGTHLSTHGEGGGGAGGDWCGGVESPPAPELVLERCEYNDTVAGSRAPLLS